ncbi:hypothetical protein [Streptomyces sp. NPDC056683]|uniref:hypothetical protein n=1 Tax=Streptomyces sp. NPDC056683 TaxID=3345910 RepID=UPI0036843C61
MEGLPRGECSVAQIERDRWHRDPQLRIKLETEARPTLYVRFDAPAALGKIDVQLAIQDDFDRSSLPAADGGPTQGQVEEII